MCEYASITKLLYDWQTLIAGGMALAAGVGTGWITRSAARQQVAAANRQTEAVKQQNTELKTEARRNLARNALTSITLIESVLSRIQDDIDRVIQLTNQPQFGGVGGVAPRGVPLSRSIPFLAHRRGTSFRNSP
jgi:hypothetical protein